MKLMTILMTGAVMAMTGILGVAAGQEAPVAVHVKNSFRFVVKAPLERAAPLFGPEGERCWAGERWDPTFVYPQPGKDVEGMVFTLPHGDRKSVWVNTVFDLKGGRMQYVAVVPEAMVSVIDVRLSAGEAGTTVAEVTYARTALEVGMNEKVRAMGEADAKSGAEWESSIAGCLAKGR